MIIINGVDLDPTWYLIDSTMRILISSQRRSMSPSVTWSRVVAISYRFNRL